jgi:hypothetical protein
VSRRLAYTAFSLFLIAQPLVQEKASTSHTAVAQPRSTIASRAMAAVGPDRVRGRHRTDPGVAMPLVDRVCGARRVITKTC